MKSLLRATLPFATLLVFAPLVALKLNELFPAMDTIAWTTVAATFVFITAAALLLDNRVERIWPERFDEERRMWLSILVAYVLTGLLVYSAWFAIGDYLAAHFGPSTMH